MIDPTNEQRRLLERLYDSTCMSTECSRRHEGTEIGKMFGAMSEIFDESAREIERLMDYIAANMKDDELAKENVRIVGENIDLKSRIAHLTALQRVET